MGPRAGWIVVALLALAAVGTAALNVVLVSRARAALDQGLVAPDVPAPSLGSHLALLVPESPDAFYTDLTEGVRAAAAQARVAVQVIRCRPGEAETWFQVALSSRVDGLILALAPDQTPAGASARAAEARVVLVAAGDLAPGQAGVTSSRFLQGIEAGNLAARLRGRAARVGLILPSDAPADPAADALHTGVLTALQTFAGARLAAVVRAKPGLFSGEEAVSNLLRAEPSVNVIIGSTAPLSEGAAQVVVDLGRVGQITLVGTDRSAALDRLVAKGVVAATVVRDARLMGARAVEAYLQGRAGFPLKKTVEVGFSVRTSKEGLP